MKRNVTRHPLIYKRHRDELYRELGIPDRMNPDFSQAPKRAVIGRIGPVTLEADVFVLNAPAAQSLRPDPDKKSKAHRVWVLCPACGVAKPLSRIHQHYKSEKCLQASADTEVAKEFEAIYEEGF